MDVLRERLRALLGVELEELAGATVSGELPVRADVVNRLIAAKLAGGTGPLIAVRVQPVADNLIDVGVTPRLRLLPFFRVEARIVQQPALPERPLLLLRWTVPGAGMLVRLAAPFISNLESLPPGVRIDGELAAIDLRQLLAAHGAGELLQYVKALRIETRPGAFVVKFELAV